MYVLESLVKSFLSLGKVLRNVESRGQRWRKREVFRYGKLRSPDIEGHLANGVTCGGTDFGNPFGSILLTWVKLLTQDQEQVILDSTVVSEESGSWQLSALDLLFVIIREPVNWIAAVQPWKGDQ